MSDGTSAAIWGGISGGAFGTLGSILVLILQRYLQRRGALECLIEEWRLSWIVYRSPYAYMPDDPVGAQAENTYYRRYLSDEDEEYKNFAEYKIAVELINKADVESILRDVHVAFLKEGGVLFTHRPFDVDKTEDPSGISEENYQVLTWADQMDPGTIMPQSNLHPVGTISLPSRSPIKVRLKGYVRNPELHYIRGGYDEVRLRGTKGDGKLLDVRIPDSKYEPR